MDDWRNVLKEANLTVTKDCYDGVPWDSDVDDSEFKNKFCAECIYFVDNLIAENFNNLTFEIKDCIILFFIIS